MDISSVVTCTTFLCIICLNQPPKVGERLSENGKSAGLYVVNDTAQDTITPNKLVKTLERFITVYMAASYCGVIEVILHPSLPGPTKAWLCCVPSLHPEMGIKVMS